MGRPRQGVEPLGGDRAAAAGAIPVRPVVEPLDGGIDRSKLLFVAVAQGQVTLLLEDLAGGRGLRSVRHRIWRHDHFGDPRPEPVALREQGGARVVEQGVGHVRIVLGGGGWARWPWTPGEYQDLELST